ncbi:hypothetical protein BHO_0900076 (plasmid) [Borrelia hermsii YBT]|uniref:Uncharacterized protein n=1 Tax=Borrelia hermsii YBT TaxID=1313295 RepID=W5T2A3_BORHE|nr:hypothetical protein BHO_0900076 [Borrelia hermsii YBT]
MVLFVIINTKLSQFFYYINNHFTKIVSKFWAEKRIVYKKITSTPNLVKSEIFTYNKIYKFPKLHIQCENLTLD